MEKEAAAIIFMCSEDKVKLRYTSLLGNGDTQMIKYINDKIQPYSPGFVVTKEECVGHVAKRFHKRLTDARRAKVTDATGTAVSMQGINGMTETTSRLLTRYYKGAILNNTGDVDGDIFAIFYHTISTDEDPHHELCPEGECTWCSYNKHKHETTKYPHRDIPVHKHKKHQRKGPKSPQTLLITSKSVCEYEQARLVRSL